MNKRSTSGLYSLKGASIIGRVTLNVLWIVALIPAVLLAQESGESNRKIIEVPSTVDGTRQPSYLILPEDINKNNGPVPIVVSLHSWSFGFQQRLPELEAGVAQRGWIYLFPDFRGRNDEIEACASDIAKQDVIDALDWVISRYPVDQNRVYVTGKSGGGFMTLAIVASYPERWSAASAWVPLSDLRTWYDFHARDSYGEMTRQCVGGDPADDAAIAVEMDRRSPLYRLADGKNVPLDIAAGGYDGHDGAAIPVWHSLVAFNAIAEAVGEPGITADEIDQLSRHEPGLETPKETDRVVDPSFGRRILLRRYAGQSRITIFEGAHDMIPGAALAWFDAH